MRKRKNPFSAKRGAALNGPGLSRYSGDSPHQARTPPRLEGHGSPAVVICTAAGGLAIEWKAVQRDLAEETAVVCYDRGGYGESSPGTFPRTSAQVIDELHTLLCKLGLAEQYILVGHSLGGLYVNHFARRYPDEVAGIAFLDPVSLSDSRFAHEIPKYGKMVSVPGLTSKHKMNRLLAKSGVLKLAKGSVRKLVDSAFGSLPSEDREEILSVFLRPRYWDAVVDELVQTYPSFDAVRDAGPFPPVPVKVLYHTPAKSVDASMAYGIPEKEAVAIETLWEALIREFLELSPRSEWVVAKHSGHMLHIDEPELVVESVKELVRVSNAENGGAA